MSAGLHHDLYNPLQVIIKSFFKNDFFKNHHDDYISTFVATFFFSSSVIRISRNGWHTLLNFLFHTGLTFGVFAGGINQINAPFLCQIVSWFSLLSHCIVNTDDRFATAAQIATLAKKKNVPVYAKSITRSLMKMF